MTKILLVEDEKVLREAFTVMLQANHFDVTTASNGQEAFDLWQKDTFDLVLLDLMMPVLDGIGFLQQADPRKTAPLTRIVILSNLSSGDMLKQAMQLGAHRHEIKSNLAPRNVIDIVTEEITAPTA